MAREVAFQFFSAKSFGSDAAAKRRRAQFQNTLGTNKPGAKSQDTGLQD